MPSASRKIGQKVGAAEVILVGISELGDVILTMQRIDVALAERRARGSRTRSPRGRRRRTTQLDGYLQRLLPPGDFLRYGVIDIVVEPGRCGGHRRRRVARPRRRSSRSSCTPRRATTSASRRRASSRSRRRVALPPDGEIKVEAQLSRRGAQRLVPELVRARGAWARRSRARRAGRSTSRRATRRPARCRSPWCSSKVARASRARPRCRPGSSARGRGRS